VNRIKLFLQTCSVLLISLLLFCCTVTTTKKKPPVFSKSDDSISRDVNSIILTQEIDVHGKEITSNGKVSSELTVNLINPKNLPSDSSERNRIAEEVAAILKLSLKDPNSFDSYKVLFVHRVIEGSVTKDNYTGQIYKSETLKSYIYDVSLGDKFDSSIFRAIGKNIFSNNDPEIVSAFTYYNAVPNLPIALKMYKETDSGSVLLTVREQGQSKAGNNYLLNKFKVADFYKIKQLNSADYKIEYVLNDSIAGVKAFKLL
jgi:hypothetical protein